MNVTTSNYCVADLRYNALVFVVSLNQLTTDSTEPFLDLERTRLDA